LEARYSKDFFMETGLIFGGLGLLAGALLTVSSKLFEIETDERLDEIAGALPGVNCGACGYAGCSDYARAVAESGAPVNLCKPGGQEAADKIAAVMGITAGEITPQIAVVYCRGNKAATSRKFLYRGIQSCKAADRFYSGSGSCSYGCLAYGDCVKVCPQNAISVIDELAHIDKTLCIGCGLCEKECPNHVIRIRDIGKSYDVRCNSLDNGKTVKANCKAGCIGCKICAKNCPAGAIDVTDNLARIDYSKCTDCGLCATKCPVKVITKCY
jgi:Na+-translocating ferredoxin:NAD+ oxidoreductase RNF subunit RnfB